MATIKAIIKQILGWALQHWRGPLRQLAPELWGLSYRDRALSLGSRPLQDVLTQFGSPLHVVFEERLVENFKGFQSEDPGAKAGCEVFLSYKTNPVPGILGRLHHLGAGADVISEYELWLALRLGVAPERIVYNGPAKSNASLEQAIAVGIRAININHWDEVARIRALAKKLGKKAAVGIRITGRGWAGQFGFPMAGGATIDRLRELLSFPELKVMALHCHRGHSIRTPEDVQAHVGTVLEFCERAKARCGWLPDMLDLGGSLGIPTARAFSNAERRASMSFYLPSQPPDPAATLTSAAYARQVVSLVETWFANSGHSRPQIIIEPGRALTGNAQALLCKVIDIKKAAGIDYAIIEVGSSHARIMADEFHQVLPLAQQSGAEQVYRMVGPICHTGDVAHFAWRCGPLQRGDALAIMDSGAYFSSDAASFSFPRPGVALIDAQQNLHLLRKTETFEHLSSLDNFWRRRTETMCMATSPL